MSSKNVFYYINITSEAFIAANYLAKLRNLYEFQRNGHLYIYDKPTYQMEAIQKTLQLPFLELSKGNTAIGILSEMLIFNDLTKYIQQKHFQAQQEFQSPKTLQQFMIEQSCCYRLGIGSYDNGFDISKNDTKIDIKCYGNKIVENTNEIENLNLLVDKRQFSNSKADIYIQTFILNNNDKLFLIIAGYANNNMLVLNSTFQNPAYCCQISNLLPYEHFRENYF